MIRIKRILNKTKIKRNIFKKNQVNIKISIMIFKNNCFSSKNSIICEILQFIK